MAEPRPPTAQGPRVAVTEIIFHAAEFGLDIEIFHSNLEGEVINKLYEANDKGFDAVLFNPAGLGRVILR